MSNAVRVRSAGYLTQEITAGKHVLLADEPKEDGGADDKGKGRGHPWRVAPLLGTLRSPGP